MASNAHLLATYLKLADQFGQLSKAKKRKVGAIVVTEKGIILPGFNGTAPGQDNNCEFSIDGTLVTKHEVIHAEWNAIAKAANSTLSCENASLYVTYFPCFTCSKLIVASGIKTVCVLDDTFDPGLRDRKSKNYLNSNGVLVNVLTNHDIEILLK